METAVSIRQFPLSVVITKTSKSLQRLSSAVRLVMVPHKYQWVRSGDVMQTPKQGEILLGQHHTSRQYQAFLGISVTERVSATESYTETHPVTNMPGKRLTKPPIELPVGHYEAFEDDQLGLPVGINYLVLGKAVTRDWQINGKRVRSVIKKVGLYFIEVEAFDTV